MSLHLCRVCVGLDEQLPEGQLLLVVRGPKDGNPNVTVESLFVPRGRVEERGDSEHALCVRSHVGVLVNMQRWTENSKARGQTQEVM